MTRLGRAAWWALPSLLCLWIYWLSLRTWFFQDDFAWLGLRLSIANWSDFWRTLFEPMAQGTIRVFSERAFFLLFDSLFGLNAFPYHLWVFLTQAANLLLIASITRIITGSAVAGFLAPVLWMINSALSGPMSWASGYNQILCAFFLLAAFRLWLKYLETGRTRDYAAQFAVFVLGFGALELNVVYPALAAAYAAVRAPRKLGKAIPLFLVSILYAVIHRWVAGARAGGVYQMHWDRSIFSTLWVYVQWALGPLQLELFERYPLFWLQALTWVVLALVLWFVWLRKPLSLFFVAWFLIVLAPLLPLRDHLSGYYLTVPTIGLAMLMAWALSEARHAAVWVRALALTGACIYAGSHIPVTRFNVWWAYHRSVAVRDLFAGISAAHEHHPGTLLLLNGLPPEIFWASIPDDPFRLINARVLMTPENLAAVGERPEIPDLSPYALPGPDTLRAIERGLAQVYDASTPRLRNITRSYFRAAAPKWKDQLPSRIDGSMTLYDPQFVSGWYPPENGFRWMSGQGVVQLGKPSGASELRIQGTAPEELLRSGPVKLSVEVNQVPSGEGVIERPGVFEFRFALPPSPAGPVTVMLRSAHVFSTPADGRELSLNFGILAIR